MAANKLEANNLTNRGRGRPKGSQNKQSKEAKDAIADAAEKLGGSDRLFQWAQESPDNEKTFWATIYPKLVAVSLSGSLNASLVIKTGVPRAGN